MSTPVICWWCRREEHAMCGKPRPGVTAPTEQCGCICPRTGFLVGRMGRRRANLTYLPYIPTAPDWGGESRG